MYCVYNGRWGTRVLRLDIGSPALKGIVAQIIMRLAYSLCKLSNSTTKPSGEGHSPFHLTFRPSLPRPGRHACIALLVSLETIINHIHFASTLLMMFFPLLLLVFAFTTQAAKHHFFVGSYGTPSIYGVEFDGVANSLSVTKNNTTRKENEWLAISHDAKTLYSSGSEGWSSFPITSSTTLGTQSPSAPGNGNCGAWNGVFVMASRKAPYPLYGSLNCANWVSTGPDGEVGKATALPYNEVAVIYGMATDPTYSYLYSSDWRNGKIWTHKIGSDGSLTVVGFTESPSNASAPRTLQVHPSGKSMYVILEAWNVMALYYINETTHMPYYTNALYPLVPPDTVAGNYGAQSAVLSAKGSMIWVTAHSRVIGQPGYLSGFSLREDGLPADPLFQIKTRNSGGKSLNVAASPFNENLVAVTESELGSVGIYKWNGKTAEMVASVDIVDNSGKADGGCCSDAVWLD